MQNSLASLRAYPKTKRRLSLILIAFALLCAYLLFTVFRMQVFSYAKYSEMVRNQISTETPLLAERGSIYGRNGELLAASKTVWRVYLSPVDIHAKSKKSGKDYADLIAKGLSELLGVSYDTVFARAKKNGTIDQTVTLFPFFASTNAKAMPQLPAPITLTSAMILSLLILLKQISFSFLMKY